MQAVLVVLNLKKFPTFVEKKENQKLYDGLKDLEKFNCSDSTKLRPKLVWIYDNFKRWCKFTRNDLVEHLEANKIQTRNLFAGNMIDIPCLIV